MDLGYVSLMLTNYRVFEWVFQLLYQYFHIALYAFHNSLFMGLLTDFPFEYSII